MADEVELCTKLSEKVKMAGFLEKKGSMLWKRYWFVLEDKLLLFYKSQFEYINLSPCRGSVNMGLVSTVQQRRNSKEHIIQIVSRFNNLVLKAKDRATQEKWMQALLESIGKPGLATLKYSLDNLMEDTQSSTLPRRTYGGSLDAVWRQPVIPKTKIVGKVQGYEEEQDENQNIGLYGTINRNHKKLRKTMTLDRETEEKTERKFDKIRSAISRKKSTASCSTADKVPKTRKDSFLRKIFRRSTSMSEVNELSDEVPEPLESVRPESPSECSERRTPDLPVTDSDVDDPLYDKIHPSVTADDSKNKHIGRILMPAGTMEELKVRLRNKSEQEREPPELPPRISGNFSTEAQPISLGATENESEDSEVSGNYQVIKKPHEVSTAFREVDMSDDSETSGHYQKIRNPAKEASEQAKNPEVPSSPSSLLWPTMESVNTEKAQEDEYQVVDLDLKRKLRLSKAEKSLNSVDSLDTVDRNLESTSPLEVTAKSEDLQENRMKSGEDVLIGACTLPAPEEEISESPENLDKSHDIEPAQVPTSYPIDVIAQSEKHSIEAIDSGVDENNTVAWGGSHLSSKKQEEPETNMEKPDEPQVMEAPFENLDVPAMYPIEVITKSQEVTTDSTPSVVASTDNDQGIISDETETKIETLEGGTTIPQEENEKEVQLAQVEDPMTTPNEEETISSKDVPQLSPENALETKNMAVVDVPPAKKDLHDLEAKKAVAKQEMEKGLCDLSNMLNQLAQLSAMPLISGDNIEPPPLSPKIKTKIVVEDPDYDYPRPIISASALKDENDDVIQATAFFNEAGTRTSANNSLEPDSLEEKKS